MRSFFYCATLSSVLAFTSSVKAADGVFTKSFDTNAMINAKDDSVIPASCVLGSSCSDNSDSNACGSNFGMKPMKLNCNACDCGNWLQNTSAFSGVEAFKSIGDTLIRLSVGVEDVRDLRADLEAAFESMGGR